MRRGGSSTSTSGLRRDHLKTTEPPMETAIWILLIVVCLSGLGYLRGIKLLLDADRDPDIVRWREDAAEREIDELERWVRLK